MRRICSRLARTAVLTAVLAAVLTTVAVSPAAATTVIRNKTITDLTLPAGAHDRIYDNCTFKSTRRDRAVIQIDKAAHHITFRDCVIKPGAWNGITINDWKGTIHHIKFLRCRIKSQKRMGFECTGRPTNSPSGYRSIKIVRCTFEPQGSEAISFDGGPNCVDNVVDRTVIKGAGTNSAFPWGQGFECNGPRRMRFTNNKVYQCRGSLLNLQMHTTADCGWVFRNNTLDASVTKQRVPMGSTSQVVIATSVHGGDFRNNRVRAAKPGGGVAWFGDCHRMDWGGTSWKDSRGGSYARPMQQRGCSGNRF
ncbi:MAG: hypothetical protein GX624_01560 [Actinobacteria bacterium]|nr:hypothetical protein [Actinomycetota bacterium]